MGFQYILKMADGRKLKGSKKQCKGLHDKANSEMKDTALYIFLIILEHFRSALLPHLPLGESEGNEVFPAFSISSRAHGGRGKALERTRSLNGQESCQCLISNAGAFNRAVGNDCWGWELE